MSAAPHPVTIILAEDDDGHATLIQRQLERACLANGFLRLKDGQEVWEYFRGEGNYAGGRSTRRSCCCSTSTCRGWTAWKALRALKADPRTAVIPVIMLTTTDDPREAQRCYQLGCSVYVTKPVDYQSFIDAVKRLGLFLQVVQVPRNGGPTGG